MATIDATGITTQDLSQHFTALQTKFKETFGEDLVVDSESPQGQLIGIFAEVCTEIDEGFVQLFSSFGIDTAGGSQLDELLSLANVRRNLPSRSVVTCQVSGEPGTLIPAASRIQNTNEDNFVLRRDITIGSDNSGEGVFQAVEFGNIPVAEETVNQIVSVITGWETVDNETAGVAGEVIETDFEFRLRGKTEVAKNSTGTIPALQAALSRVGVTRSRIVENDTASPVSHTGLANVTAHSIACIVEGGLDNSVAQTIADYKTSGTNTFGSDSGTTDDGRTVNFERVAHVAVKISVTVNATDSFPNNGVNLLKQALVSHANNQFDIGESIDMEALRVPIYSINGVALSSISVTDTSDAALPDATPIQRLYTLSTANIEVTTS